MGTEDGLEYGTVTTGAVAEVRGDVKLGPLAKAHLHDALVPALDHLLSTDDNNKKKKKGRMIEMIEKHDSSPPGRRR